MVLKNGFILSEVRIYRSYDSDTALIFGGDDLEIL